MGSVNLPTVAAMSDIHQAINVLIVVMLTGIGGVFATLFATFKWYIPSRFKQQTAERELRLKEIEAKIALEGAASNADTQRDLVLPQLVAGMNATVASNGQLTQNIGALIQNRLEQDARTTGELHATAIAVTGVTEGLEDLRGDVRAMQRIMERVADNVKTDTDTNLDNKTSIALAIEQINLTLQMATTFGLKLDTILKAAKSDSRPIPLLMDADSSGVPPQDLQATG